MSKPGKTYRFRYTSDQAKEIRTALERAGFQSKAEWPALLKAMNDIASNARLRQERDTLSPPLYVGAADKRTARFVKALIEARTALASIPIEIQSRFFSVPIEGIEPLLALSLREAERPAILRLLSPERFACLLSVVAQQVASPGLFAGIRKTGAPKDEAVRYAVRELWCVFEQATGKEPKAYPSNYGRGDERFAGPFYEFVKAALGPTRISDEKTLGSKIHAAYTEWRKSVRPSVRRPNIKTLRR